MAQGSGRVASDASDGRASWTTYRTAEVAGRRCEVFDRKHRTIARARTGTWSVAWSVAEPEGAMRRNGSLPEFAREAAGAWTSGGPSAPGGGTTADAALHRAIDGLAAFDIDDATDDALRECLRGVQRGIERLTAIRSRLTTAVQARAVRAAGVGRENHAAADTREFLTGELGLTAAEAKRVTQTGRRLKDAPAARKAFHAGDLREGHADVITDTLQHLEGEERDRVEAALIEAAATQDPVALRRTANRLLGEADQKAAENAAARRHARRSARIFQNPDGTVSLSASLSGLDAELALTCVHAFRLPDAPGESRTPEQRTADALVTIFEVALRAGKAPSVHGVRPHVSVIVRASDLMSEEGVVDAEHTGPMSFGEIRALLDDCSISRIVVGPDSVPIEVGGETRTVPAGLYRALSFRDGGCTWHGCQAPVAWCDVAHGMVPYRNNGKLSLGNAALLCRRHHRRFDAGGWRLEIDGPKVVYHRVGADPPVGSRAGP